LLTLFGILIVLFILLVVLFPLVLARVVIAIMLALVTLDPGAVVIGATGETFVDTDEAVEVTVAE